MRKIAAVFAIGLFLLAFFAAIRVGKQESGPEREGTSGARLRRTALSGAQPQADLSDNARLGAISPLGSNKSLTNLGMIVGAAYDATRGFLNLIGNGEHQECSPSLQQIAVAFRWAFADSATYNYLSIDPWPDDPRAPWMKVRINPEAQDTEFGWTMFEADRLLKSYSLGKSTITGVGIVSSVPGYMNVLQISHTLATKGRKSGIWSRFWLYPRHNAVEATDEAVRISEAFIGVQTETMRWQQGRLVPAGQGKDPSAEEFARFFSEHYSAFAVEEPVFRQVEQLMRLLLVSEWIRHRRIPVDLDWIERHRKSVFRLPRVTPALNVSQETIKRSGNVVHIKLLELFGGVNLNVEPNYINRSRGFLKWALGATQTGAAKVGGAFSFESGGDQYYGIPFPAASRPAGPPNIETLLQLDLPSGRTMRLQRRRTLVAYSPYGSQENWELALPVLRAIYPEGREGKYRTLAIQGRPGSEVTVRHYQLFDADGTSIGQFESHDIDQGLGKVVVRPSSPNIEWQLYPQGDGIVWASGPANRRLAFDGKTGKIMAEQRDNELIRYHYNTYGMLSRITNEDGSYSIDMIQGSNGYRIIGARTSQGSEVRFLDGPVPTEQEHNITAYNSIGRAFSVSIQLQTGDWYWVDDPQRTPAGLDYLNRCGPELIRILALPRGEQSFASFIPDGGFTLIVTGSKVLPLPANCADLPKGWMWEDLPETTPIVAVDRTTDGRTAVLQKVGDNYQLTFLGRDYSVTSIQGPDALADFEDIARERVQNASTNMLTFVHAAIEGNEVIMQAGQTQKRLPVSEMKDLRRNPRSAESALDDVFPIKIGKIREVVVYRDATDRRPSSHGGSLKADSDVDPVLLAAMINERYDNVRAYLDDETTTAKINHSRISPLRSASDLGVLAPAESFKVEDHGVIKSVEHLLHKYHIKLIEVSTDAEGIPNILIISGHNDEQLSEYLTDLGKQGVLRDRLILLNTCYAQGQDTPNLLHSLISRFGAKGIFLHTESISPLAIPPVINEIGQLLQHIEESGQQIHPADLLSQAADRALEKETSTYLRDEIRKFKRGALQISAIRCRIFTSS